MKMNKKIVLNNLMQALRFVGLVLLSLIFIFDRLIVSFMVYSDMPGLKELLKFKHEQERFKKRIGLYGSIAILILIIKLIF